MLNMRESVQKAREMSVGKLADERVDAKQVARRAALLDEHITEPVDTDPTPWKCPF